MAAAAQLESFNERLSRIQDPSNVSYFDQESGMNIPKRLSPTAARKKVAKRTGIVGLLFSVVLGAFAMLAISALFFRIGLVDQWYPALTMGIAAVASIVMGTLLKLKGLPTLLAQGVGLAAMIIGMHNLILLFPKQFALIYSSSFVEMIQASTELRTALILGQSYAF